MIIGIGKEIKIDEKRVALQPHQAHELILAGNKILLEQDAGVLAGFSNEEYAKYGVDIVSKEYLYEKSDMIVKVKEPLVSEYGFLRDGQVLFTYLHFDGNMPCKDIVEIVNTKVTAIAYEWVREENNNLPLLNPMSDITGTLYALRSMDLLMQNKGKLPGNYFKNVEAPKVLLIGLGHIGMNALKVYLMNNLQIDIVDKHPETLEERVLRHIDKEVWENAKKDVNIIKFDSEAPTNTVNIIDASIQKYDIILNAAVRREDLPKSKLEYLITGEMIKKMTKGSIICDAPANIRDFIETAVPTEELYSTYEVDGIVHYNCDHLPAYTPHASTKLLTAATFPYVKLLAEGFESAVQKCNALYEGTMCYKGELIHEYTGQKKNIKYSSLNSLINS
jgi:alanine dehydrogenase